MKKIFHALLISIGSFLSLAGMEKNIKKVCTFGENIKLAQADYTTVMDIVNSLGHINQRNNGIIKQELKEFKPVKKKFKLNLIENSNLLTLKFYYLIPDFLQEYSQLVNNLEILSRNSEIDTNALDAYYNNLGKLTIIALRAQRAISYLQ